MRDLQNDQILASLWSTHTDRRPLDQKVEIQNCTELRWDDATAHDILANHGALGRF